MRLVKHRSHIFFSSDVSAGLSTHAGVQDAGQNLFPPVPCVDMHVLRFQGFRLVSPVSKMVSQLTRATSDLVFLHRRAPTHKTCPSRVSIPETLRNPTPHDGDLIRFHCEMSEEKEKDLTYAHEWMSGSGPLRIIAARDEIRRSGLPHVTGNARVAIFVANIVAVL